MSFVRFGTVSAISAIAFAFAATAPLLIGATRAADDGGLRSGDETSLTDRQLLGKRIFEDASLSEPPGVACASCHDSRKAYQGNNHSPIPALALGSRHGVYGDRKTPTIMYGSFSPPFGFIDQKNKQTGEIEKVPAGGLFWDGRANSLIEQVEGPLLNPREMNNPSKEAVVEKIRKGDYVTLARSVLGAEALAAPDAFKQLAATVAEFESTPRFAPFNSKFDGWLLGREKLSRIEAKGLELFKDPKKGNCISCHDGKEDSRNPRDWLFTDFTYDILGAPRNAAIPDNVDKNHFDPGLCKRSGLMDAAPKDFEAASVCGAFRVPTLRNVAIRAPYMHNGVFRTLREAVAFYFTRDTNPARWYPKKGRVTAKFDDLPMEWRENVNVKEVPYDRKPGQKPRATDAEIDALVAFLGALTDRPDSTLPGAAK